jgi:hypothetical protein
MITESRVCYNGVATRALSVPGDGSPIVLLHGFADSADTWRGVLTALEREGRQGDRGRFTRFRARRGPPARAYGSAVRFLHGRVDRRPRFGCYGWQFARSRHLGSRRSASPTHIGKGSRRSERSDICSAQGGPLRSSHRPPPAAPPGCRVADPERGCGLGRSAPSASWTVWAGLRSSARRNQALGGRSARHSSRRSTRTPCRSVRARDSPRSQRRRRRVSRVDCAWREGPHHSCAFESGAARGDSDQRDGRAPEVGTLPPTGRSGRSYPAGA